MYICIFVPKRGYIYVIFDELWKYSCLWVNLWAVVMFRGDVERSLPHWNFENVTTCIRKVKVVSLCTLCRERKAATIELLPWQKLAMTNQIHTLHI